ncbi:MAG: hypothetical protein VKK97_01265 [Synechococcaceae cyanobacterium]|nr:hypothetical protein [Synechococcaceae cyanobacterium]
MNRPPLLQHPQPWYLRPALAWPSRSHHRLLGLALGFGLTLLPQLAREQQTTIIMVTHDNKILDVADRIIIVEDGALAGTEAEAAFIRKMRDSGH